ncbi:multidrug ABC transporter ATP-binding protein [Lachnospiraceae bacterium]|uniref:ABC-F family ATP-binding cassette domain-containing protein n=1 Tax=Extibacter sp. GGCC_0201 TaxID=2731209 RepID=UPI001AA0EAA0|nr:ABC-F family ATP-binding cassette domain-containing protein [Extibacter sp. GGCC_0201]MBO1720583.1 ABC-F family ATP-binding cassette domain-containing protein [Extibacter sp. GGCC_0201]BDF34743.1 multidrug ABC transporter ATP-binding protein [Lachnospiraceae bacterium]BDF38745.1 multidrug ABC transporter ATP-binding protein [Lachnospiraceae bacterium]
MNLLTMEGITKSYTDKLLLDGVDFSINDNDKIGIVGVNGTGKSTLLKVVAGIEKADSGIISAGNNVKLRYLPQNPVFDEAATILEAVLKDNVDKGNEWTMESEAKAMINRLGLPSYDTKADTLSGGQKKRTALAGALLAPVDILVLDEPTNHLDGAMAEWLEQYLVKFRGAIVMVTHDRYFLDRVATRIVEIERASLYNYPGRYSDYVNLKMQRQDMESAAERKRQSLLRTELKWLARGARARSTKQKAHIGRIEALQEQSAPEQEKSVSMSSLSSRMGKKTVEAAHIAKSYGGQTVIADYSYTFLRNDRIGIVGENGCGKSTLLKIITGNLEPDFGSVEIGETIKMGYFSQENEYMDDSMRVIDYAKEAGEYVTIPEGTISASQMLERFLFDGTLQWSRIGKLSGGEKRRLYLLRILMEAPNVLVLDEPTNDLDIQTLNVLEDYLDEFDGIVIAVSHDRYFLDRIVNRIFAFEGEGRIAQYEGGYSDYLLKKGQSGHSEPEREKGQKEKTAKSWKTGEKKLKFTYKEKQEFEAIDGEIAALEEQVKNLEERMLENATNSAALNELMQEKKDTEQMLENKMERWVYLNDLNDRINSQS